MLPDKYANKLKSSVIIDSFVWHSTHDFNLDHSLFVQETEAGELYVENLSGHDISDITVYHRTFIQEGNYYIGGKAFETRIPFVASGKIIEVLPQYYAYGYSKIVWIGQKSAVS